MLLSFINHFFALLPIFFLILCRISAFFMMAPIFSERALPMQIRLVLALLVSLIIFPIIHVQSTFSLMSLEGALIVLQQILIGISIGFIFALVFQIAIITGEIIAFQLGLGFAAMNDPSVNTEGGFVSLVYWLGMSLLFLSVDGHLELCKIMVSTFQSLPISPHFPDALKLDAIFNFFQIMYSSAVSIALPTIFAVLGVNIIFGLMARSSPQFNIFTVGFPIILIFGFMIVYFDFSRSLLQFQDLFRTGFRGVEVLTGQNHG